MFTLVLFCSGWRCNKHNVRPYTHVCFPPGSHWCCDCPCYIPVSHAQAI
uniref:Uncharacterized protein n=1 Tax=Rhizophora mucronata TaxID=61149 RepID=A0A2P2M462_RHIMU